MCGDGVRSCSCSLVVWSTRTCWYTGTGDDSFAASASGFFLSFDLKQPDLVLTCMHKLTDRRTMQLHKLPPK